MLTLMQSFKRLMSGRNFGLLARHLGCGTSKLIAFYNGQENALTADQQEQLYTLIQDLYSGRTPKGGTNEENGETKWTSLRRRDEQ